MSDHKSINHLKRNLECWKEKRNISQRKIERYKKFIKKHKGNIETYNIVIVNIETELDLTRKEVEQLKAERDGLKEVVCKGSDECASVNGAFDERDKIERKLQSDLIAALEREKKLQRELAWELTRVSKLECGEAYADTAEEIAKQRDWDCFESEGE